MIGGAASCVVEHIWKSKSELKKQRFRLRICETSFDKSLWSNLNDMKSFSEVEDSLKGGRNLIPMEGVHI